MSSGRFIRGYVLPGLPHLVLAAEKNLGWLKVKQAMEQVRDEVQSSGADLLVIYSTYWPSVIGHQIQADPSPEWVHVDEEFHALGTIPYKLRVDTPFSEAYQKSCEKRGLQARLVAYKGFPVDTGSVVVSKIINPTNQIPICIVSSNIYSDRAETLVLGKAAKDTVEAMGKKAIAIVVSSLSNRLHAEPIDPETDHFHSLKDNEWNKKFLEFLGDGRLEDVSQLSRQFHREARVNKVANFKPFWWLAASLGQNNLYAGKVYEYQPIFGSGAAVVGLTPAIRSARDLEFDENDPDVFVGERNVLGPLREDGPIELELASHEEIAYVEPLPDDEITSVTLIKETTDFVTSPVIDLDGDEELQDDKTDPLRRKS